MKKRIKTAAVFCMLLALLVHAGTALAAAPDHTDEAEALQTLGLLKGSSAGFELERAPSRIEAAVMLVRLLGKENQALEQNNAHPFTDVPSWAGPYIGYLYQNGLTAGTGNNLFGSAGSVGWKDYLTFILRALGYSDKNGDFTYDGAAQKAVGIGLVKETDIGASAYLLRNDMVDLSFKALLTKLKGADTTLADKLEKDGVFTDEAGLRAGVLQARNTQGSVTLNFSDVTTDSQGHALHTLKIKRAELPESVRNFYKFGIVGIGKPLDAVHKYMVLQSVLKYKDENMKYVEPYDDAAGAVVSYYGQTYSAVVFYDAQNKPIGLIVYQDTETGGVSATCEPLTDDDFNEPAEIADVVSQFGAIAELTSGYSVTFEDGNAVLTVDYGVLTGLLPKACYYDIMGISDSVMTDTLKYSLLTTKDGRRETLSADCKPISTIMSDGGHVLVAIYDEANNLIAYKLIG